MNKIDNLSSWFNNNIFPNLNEFENELTEEEKSFLAKEEITLLNEEYQKISKKIDRQIKKINKLENEIIDFLENDMLAKMDEITYNSQKFNYIKKLNKLYLEFEILKRQQKSIFEYKKERENFLKNEILKI